MGSIGTPAIFAILLFALAPYLLLAKSSLRWYALGDATLWLPLITFLAVAGSVDSGLLAALIIAPRLLLFAVIAHRERHPSARPGSAGLAIFATSFYLALLIANLQWPIDGDEPYYLLMSESIVSDVDLDLANQFEQLEGSVTGRPDLEPQWGDRILESGEIRSHHEPALSFLVAPGLVIAGRFGAIAIVCLLGGVLAWSLAEWASEIGIADPTRTAGFFAFVLGPPVVYYSSRLWPEVPAALCFVMALRAVERRRFSAAIVWTVPLMLLKLRFVPIGIVIAGLAGWLAWKKRSNRPVPVSLLLTGVVALAAPFVVMFLVSGSGTGVHTFEELRVQALGAYLRGGAGLLVDAQAGLLFQAPLLLTGIGGLLSWKSLPLSLRCGIVSALPYLFLLLPRAEWHGGWSPPLRYLVVLLPLAAIGLMRIERKLPSLILGAAALWTAGLVFVAVAWPWRLFRIADGESLLGASLSRIFEADFSRLLPSLIRPEPSHWFWLVAIVVLVAVALVERARGGSVLTAIVATTVLGLFVAFGERPGKRVELEDAHVVKRGGELFPERWTVARFRFSGGWQLEEGESLRFGTYPGPARLGYSASEPATIRVDGELVELPPIEGEGTANVELDPRDGDTEIEVVEGRVVLDWIERD